MGCDSTVRELLAQGTQMDIFVLDSDGDDSVIRDWARRVGVPADRGTGSYPGFSSGARGRLRVIWGGGRHFRRLAGIGSDRK